MADDGLSASQIRARHNVPANTKDWGESGDGDNTMMIAAVVGLLVVGAIVMYVVKAH